ncbi:hypothetical protein GG344DRAFT_65157 [Lentinula edodes]|nr:hypothetical protein GG344DRAFT_65157 [Lentinula edodes]
MILDIDTSLGYPEIGALLSGVLFGILTMQVYIYHKNFPNDSVWIKFGLVDSMWFFELAHTICEFYGLYYVTVFRYGDPTVFLAIPHELAAVPFFDGFIATIALVYHLIKNRSDTNYRSTYVVIDKLIQWAIETGVITSSVGIIEMICFLIDPTNFLWIAFYAVLPKCNYSYRAGHNSTPRYHCTVCGSADKSARDSSCSK